jgi:ankyrin repeat protein
MKKGIKNMPRLHTACYTGDRTLVQSILKETSDQKKNINEKSMGGMTALMFAALHKHWEVMELLLKHGADMNAMDDDGRDVLSILCGSILSRRINPLDSLPPPIDIDLIYRMAWALAHDAVPDPTRHPNILWSVYRDLGMVKRILRANPGMVENISSLLFVACQRNDHKMLQLLFRYGADPSLLGEFVQQHGVRRSTRNVIQTIQNSIWLDTLGRVQSNDWPAGMSKRIMMIKARLPDPESILQRVVLDMNPDMIRELASYLN